MTSINFKSRSKELELLDNQNIPKEDLHQNLKELYFINKYLGGHKAVIDAIAKIVNEKQTLEILHIVEIGSGGGDNLRAVSEWAAKKKIKIKLTGIDLKKECTDFAIQSTKDSKIEYLTSDYYKVQFEEKNKPDIIFNSLFCHHFSDPQLLSMFEWMKKNAKMAYVICDLHRHPLAYYSISLLTSLFSSSYLVKNDARLSVLRAFKKRDLYKLLDKTNTSNFKISWIWAFRWQIIVNLR